ncbi:MAG TPA: serine O-acetyltransferase [Syntrophomonadaceae bacterium]|nr:serine O-acetyltransferase [Syntrophomonadaceae bacterium]
MFSTMRDEMKVIFERDPAARSVVEIFFCYPGFHAIMNHKLAHFLYRHKHYFLARLVSHISRFVTGIEIHPGAKLGKGFFIDHGSGIVIGETAEVGDNVTLYQGVTLGGTGKDRGKRHPTVENNVVISTGAQVLGNITIGDNAKIGAGSVVLKTVPANCTVVGVPGRIVIRDGAKVEDGRIEVDLEHQMLPDPISDMLAAMQDHIEDLEKRLDEFEGEEVLHAGVQYPKRGKRRLGAG